MRVSIPIAVNIRGLYAISLHDPVDSTRMSAFSIQIDYIHNFQLHSDLHNKEGLYYIGLDAEYRSCFEGLACACRFRQDEEPDFRLVGWRH